MEYLIICTVALLGSALTLFSGFGLGTILVPVFALFFPIDLAIALTAIVHFLNNIFKIFLVGKNVNYKVVLRFGLPSMVAALCGAYILSLITKMPIIYEYSIADSTYGITPVKLIIGILLMFFSLFEIIPWLAKLEFDKKYLPVGGILSGFFGGLSGNQGALRSAFLIRSRLTKESFIATGVMIACMIDIVRLSIYSEKIFEQQQQFNYSLILSATSAAFLGAFIGNKLIKKVTIKFLQYLVAMFLFLFSILLIAGIV
jgi:uncharacterized membrane protein YfcA